LISVLEGARRIIFPQRGGTMVTEVRPAGVTFDLRQDLVSASNANISAVGSTLQTLPFNEFGRRKVYVDTNKGPVWLLQGITHLDPGYVRVQGVQMPEQGLFGFPFDFRVATTTLPGELLVRLLRNATDDLGDYQQRERIVEFLINAERYNEAIRELNQLQVDFSDLDQQRFDILKTRLVTASARLVLTELDRRLTAGQILTVKNILQSIDPQNLSPETLVEVRTRLRDLEESERELEQLKSVVRRAFETYRADQQLEEPVAQALAGLEAEITTDLNWHNRERLATYLLRAGDQDTKSDRALAFLISGWYLGAADAFDNLSVAMSLIETRELLIQYLQSVDANSREEIIQRLRQLESGNPRYLAAMARLILPWKPAPLPEPNSQGFFRFVLADLPGQPGYLVQLPPEYSPYKKYPCIVTLCDIQSQPQTALEWWDGDLNPQDGYRTGQASRNGYVVIAPDWRKPLDYEYAYDPHAARVILRSLRESLRMFSIDSDRVFLSGHGIGGEVAWDLGLAHPDLWAGVMPISALADRYISFSYDNAAKHLPFYFVVGENHIPPARGTLGNVDKREEIFQRMAKTIHHKFMVAKYVGRRSEHFLEEITTLFDWMRNRRRSFDVSDFSVRTLRPWDNFFWWFEMHDLPENLTVPPQAWNVQSEKKGVEIEAEIKTAANGNSNLIVRGGGKAATFWLSPKWVNLEQEITFNWNRSSNTRELIVPSRTVILEDLRTRSDTQNPFWARMSYDSGWVSSNDWP
jgi:pimeloyl-ACP methyl ester carboxylesterase